MRKHRQNWLDIFSGFRVALDARKIVLGTLGVDVTIIVLLGLFMLAAKLNLTGDPRGVASAIIQHPFSALAAFAGALASGQLCSALAHLGGREAAFLFGGGILILFIWSFFGGAIARVAAVDFARNERVPIGEATSFAARKFGSFFWSPLVPFIFILIFLLCNVLLGILGRAIPTAGPVIVGLLFGLAAISAFLVLLLAIGTIGGFLFMWPTIAMEGTDSFDAISRGFNYLFARPWQTLWCWLVAKVYGIAVCGFVALFTLGVLHIAERSVAAGMGGAFAPIQMFLDTPTGSAGMSVPILIAVTLIRVVEILALSLVLGFVASYAVSAMTIVYAVLRRDVDGTDMNELFMPEAEADEAAETPIEPKPAELNPAEPPADQKPA